MRRVALPALLGALVVAAPASASAAGGLALVGPLHTPTRALTAHTISVGVSVRNRGSKASRPARLAVRLGPVGSAPLPRVLGSLKVPRLAAGKKARVKARVVIPQDADRARSTFVACVPPGTQTNACASSRTVAIAGGSSLELIGAALAAHRIDLGTAYIDVFKALRGDPSLPRRYRGAGPMPTGALMARLDDDLPKLPAAKRAALLPYLMPPTLAKSAWAPRTAAHRAAAADDTSTCGAQNTPAKLTGVWTVIETPHVSVWYLLHSASGRTNAHRIAAAIEGQIWPKLTGGFRKPLSDGDAPCQGGLNGKPDIFVASSGPDFGKEIIPGGASGLTMHLQLPGPFAGCMAEPAWMLVPEDVSRSTLAHEFMHAVQAAYARCQGNGYPEWVEGTADWAMWFVYPQDQSRTVPDSPAQLWTPNAETVVPFGSSPGDLGYVRGYGWWPFWMSLSRAAGGGSTTSPVPLRRLFEASGSGALSLDDLIKAAAGTSVKDAWKRYDVERWNGGPVGKPGSPIRSAFRQWYGITAQPAGHTVSEEKLALGSLATRTFDWFGASDGQKPATTRYRWLTFADKAAREIIVQPGNPGGSPGLVIQAFLRLGNGTWRIEDWTDRKRVNLCRDQPAGDVQEMILAYADATTQGADTAPIASTVQLRNTCGFPQRFEGTWTRVYTWVGRGSWTETITGKASFVRNSVFPPEADALSSVPYELESGTVSWTVTGSADCTVFSGSGSEPATADTSFGTPTSLTLEKVTGHPGAPDPEPKPYYYSIRVGQDPQKTPPYNIKNCDGTSVTEGLVLPYLDVGYANPLNVDSPLDQVQKSDSAALLEGHRSTTDPTGTFPTDDTWSFKASG